MYFDRFDICEAFYMFSTLYHGGMHSKEYANFSRLHAIKFKPPCNISVETLTDNGKAIFDNLVEKHGF